MEKDVITNPFTGETVPVNYLDNKQRPLTPWGSEILSSIPMAPPVGYKRQPTMVEHIRDMVRSERLRQEAEAAGMETFEESEDFDVDEDDPDPHSQWENEFDPPISELREAVEAEKKKSATPPKAPSSKSPEPPLGGSPAPDEKSEDDPSAP